MYEDMLRELHFFSPKKRELRKETLLLSSATTWEEEMIEPDSY